MTIDILLYSSEQYYLTNYRKVVDSLRDVFNMIDLSCQEIVFSPLIDKQEILKTGHYPSNKLYLANDLFPYTPPKLYSDLDSMSGFRECGYLGSQEKMVQPAKLVVGG